MHIEQNKSLQSLNTFGIDTCAQYFVRTGSLTDLQTIIADDLWHAHPHLILGGGSNMLLPTAFNGIVVKNEIKGIDIIDENQDSVWVKVGAGENWHQVVMHCLSQNYAGIENLSLIPGTMGAAPIQNIGAYGVELKEVFWELTAVDVKTGVQKTFNHAECAFGYRDSVFKNSLKNKMIVADVTLKLNKTPQFRIEYSGIQEMLASMGVRDLSIQAVSDAVIQLRRSKLPDPLILPNAGSFFKNPVILPAQFQLLQQQHPKIPHYPASDSVKVPAGWLIEQAGWKGKRVGRVGVYDKQALVIVNYDHGSSEDIRLMAEHIQADVRQQFGIQLQPEVEWIS